MTDLTDEIFGIAQYLPHSDLSNLVLTHSSFYNQAQPYHLHHALLKFVGLGEQDKAQKILQAYPELMIKRGTIKIDKYYFKNNSAIELCIWTLDTRYMLGMMLDCITNDQQGYRIKKELLIQYKNAIKNGVTYTFDNKQISETHFNIVPLLMALQTYAENLEKWQADQLKDYWCNVVRKEQRLLPMHFRQHICDKTRNFSSSSFSFSEESATFNRTLKFYNDLQEKNEKTWNSSLEGLGIECAIFRGSKDYARGTSVPYGSAVGEDLNTLTTLYNKRQRDLSLFKMNLKLSVQQMEENLPTLENMAL